MFRELEVVKNGYSIVPRRWGVSLFDWATLATNHRVRFPYQIGDVLLCTCNCDLSVEAGDIDDAAASLDCLRMGLVLCGISPFICPYMSNFSINEYSAINDRESESLRQRLNDERVGGPVAPAQIVEMWPLNLTLSCVSLPDRFELTQERFHQSAIAAANWKEIQYLSGLARAFARAMLSAPHIVPLSQSLLHVWTGLESLLPEVNSELSFRLAILLAQIGATGPQRRTFSNRVKSAYKIRSRIAHGSQHDVTLDEWRETWSIAIAIGNGILDRGSVPTEESLMADVFG